MRLAAMMATLTFLASAGVFERGTAQAASASPGGRAVAPARITSPTKNIGGWVSGSAASSASDASRPPAAARLVTVQYDSTPPAPSGSTAPPAAATAPSLAAPLAVAAPAPVRPLPPRCCLPCAPRTQIHYAPVAAAYPVTVAYRPLIPLAPMPSTYYVGRGILGQPKLYVPEQPIRNFLRYISP